MVKTIFFTVDAYGYVESYGCPRSNEKEIEIELEESHVFFKSDMHCWKYVDGELVFDEEKRQQREDERIANENKLTENEMIAMAIMDLTELIMGGID